MPSDRRRMTPEELAASKATANRKRRLRMLWCGDSTISEIGEEIGLNDAEVASLAAEMGLGERTLDVYVPTPEEILRACSSLRMSWSQQERESRVVGPPRGRME